MKSHDVPIKVMEGRSWWGKTGMRLFFHRYKKFETANFPVATWGNLAAAFLIVGGICMTLLQNNPRLQGLGGFLIATSVAFFVGLTFIFTAPTIGRLKYVRRTYLCIVHYILCRFMESIDWCTGSNKRGYINHLTAHKMLDYGYVTPEQFQEVSSMAVVRNPYSRMVSIYMYNRFGRMESFPHFIRTWYRMMKDYRTTGEMEEWYTPCHAIPQFEYTHFAGKQVVQSIVKQEELKFLKNKEDAHLAVEQDSSVSNLPDAVRDALLGMPHSNKRATGKKWFEFYDQETLNLTFEMYHHDFDIFDYPVELKQRPDLKPPVSKGVKEEVNKMQRDVDTTLEGGKEMRQEMLSESARRSSRRSSMMGKIGCLDGLDTQDSMLSSVDGRADTKLVEEEEDEDPEQGIPEGSQESNEGVVG